MIRKDLALLLEIWNYFGFVSFFLVLLWFLDLDSYKRGSRLTSGPINNFSHVNTAESVNSNLRDLFLPSTKNYLQVLIYLPEAAKFRLKPSYTGFYLLFINL